MTISNDLPMLHDAAAPMIVLCIAYNVGFAAFHVAFWKVFRWPVTLAGSGRTNSAITQTLNVLITYCFIVYALALIAMWCADAPTATAAALGVGAGFWLIRACLQSALFPVRGRVSKAFTWLFAAGVALHVAAAALVASVLAVAPV